VRERVRMDQILGIVGHHDIEPAAVMFLKEQHALIDPVQAVGFRSGAVVGTDGQMDIREARFQFANRFEGRIVVRIGAYKEMIVIVVDGGDIVLHHSTNDDMFMPQRHEDGDLLFRFRLSGAARMPGIGGRA